jgi:prevent-host-death family protein
MHKTVGSRELKTRLGTYLRQVREGMTLVVTERGLPVAELRPFGSGPKGQKARLSELVELGVLTRGSQKRLAPFKAIQSSASLSTAVIESREERF